MKTNLLVIGHSHMGALARLVKEGDAILPDGRTAQQADVTHVRFLSLLHPAFSPHISGEREDDDRLNPELDRAIDELVDLTRVPDEEYFQCFGRPDSEARTIVVSYIGGNAHNLVGLLQPEVPYDFALSSEPGLPLSEAAELVAESAIRDVLRHRSRAHLAVLRRLARSTRNPIVQLGAPPVIRDNRIIAEYLPESLRSGDGVPLINAATIRYKLWVLNNEIYWAECRELGVHFCPCPSESLDDGFLAQRFFRKNDALHANGAYARLQMGRLLDLELSPSAEEHPYKTLPASAYWRKSVADVDRRQIDPVVDFPFKIQPHHRIVTAGSCFAQHIARRLSRSGFNYHVTEKPHPVVASTEAARLQYEVYSARYGNVYTARQLLQLFDRSFGLFHPLEDVWQDGKRFRDPFRPTIPPEGFSSLAELHREREVHLAAVRAAFREADVLVFTLGLTECFSDRRDGAVFPVCPGVQGGRFDRHAYEFKNFTVDEVVSDLLGFVGKLRAENEGVKVILTVSPVPLIATASRHHVLSATVYSKSVLRVAASIVAEKEDCVAYFPSYELVTGQHAGHNYFESDLRSVTTEAVDHVMEVFFRHVTDVGDSGASSVQPQQSVSRSGHDEIERAFHTVCEEELLDAFAE